MLYWPAAISEHDFSAAEIADITGVSHALQRQWRVRYLDFRQAFFVHYGPRKHGFWSWEGVQLLALFDRAMTDLGSAEMARRVLMLDQEPGITRDELGIYHSDQRAPEGGDLFIVGDLSLGGDARFATAGASYLAGMLVPETDLTSAMPRHYLLNFSAFQRDLFERVLKRLPDLAG